MGEGYSAAYFLTLAVPPRLPSYDHGHVATSVFKFSQRYFSFKFRVPDPERENLEELAQDDNRMGCPNLALT